ncbi:bifunctional diguanylate cyclase/phosphodiesterase [Alkalicoccobacillus gibsonii]|uniref:bifunctional diguanylate cyclase/phosphodiesterase n=1 Tax=Alkalicoccobacillus gibsonii TaxID=79881 RepID=UPI001932F3F1|nr:EAL domain-containing protein [Alkalicoccobacillus gibsonii]MBM0065725.1 EAL domain-containing protein [Alkalicoccobacillus gibsonii]
MEHFHGSYSLPLVLLSFIIATLASYTALDLAERIQNGRGTKRFLWLGGGALTMGIGIWSMHFIGMLAYSFQVPVYYHVGTVLLSIVLAIGASAIALLVVSLRGERHSFVLLAGGILMAAAISGMHYVGMAALSIDITYDLGVVALSIAIAALASFAALWLLVSIGGTNRYSLFIKLGCGVVMAVAITGMHYTGMAAASFQSGGELGSGYVNPKGITYWIAIGTLFTLGLTIVGMILNKRFIEKDVNIARQESWYRSLYEHNLNGILSVSADGTIQHVNDAAQEMMGMDASQVLQKQAHNLGFIDVSSEFEFRQFRRRKYDTMLTRPDQKVLYLTLMHVPVMIDEQVVGTHLMMKDITLQKQTEKQIKHLAYHDELTGLPNRRKFNELIADAVKKCKRTKQSFAVLTLDIDRFKMINDSLGHMYGDLFLQKVSNRITKLIDGEDIILSRLGGDEFVLIYKKEMGPSLESFASHILMLIQKPFHLKEHDFYISASIGIAIYPEHGREAEVLLRNADTALYEVKRNMKNGYHIYTEALNEHLEEKLTLESDLRKGIVNQELVLHYQPKFSIDGSNVLGLEALVRWQHPQKGLLPPGAFLSVAEETGLIFDVGAWVLKSACMQMKKWQDAGGLKIPVAVNISSQQFHQLNFDEHIQSVLYETGLEPKYLELEITESMMMDVKTSTQTLQRLSELGVKISLDDFGTGYSSLNYLKQFPINRLKIDRSFIADILTSEHDKAIVSTIISMAKHLKMDVTAEGIETKDQLDYLRTNDLMEIQGYYYSKPLPTEKIEALYMNATVS